MAELKLVVFDVDGTLIDSIAHIEAIMDAAFETCGLPKPAPGAVRDLIGVSLNLLLDQLHPGLSDGDLDRLGRTYKDMFMQSSSTLPYEQTSPLFSGARAALDRLSVDDHLLLGVATGKSRRGLNRLFGAHDLERYFVTAHVADDHPSKPHPAMLEACLRDTGVEAANAVMIGDTTYDLDMARAAGVKAVGVSWGNHKADRLQIAADAMLDDFDQLDEILHDTWGAR